ncbi:hypothetical protein [Streptomyces pristinaespiralis]|uniref:hypothetical protein n=1 Tax=Streptomyces pristinaespiralis TaxID=38300 RepID=UPI003833EE9C
MRSEGSTAPSASSADEPGESSASSGGAGRDGSRSAARSRRSPTTASNRSNQAATSSWAAATACASASRSWGPASRAANAAGVPRPSRSARSGASTWASNSSMYRLTGRGLGLPGVGSPSSVSRSSSVIHSRSSSTSSPSTGGADCGSPITVTSSSRSTDTRATLSSRRSPGVPACPPPSPARSPPNTNSSRSPVLNADAVPAIRTAERRSRSAGVSSDGLRRRTASSFHDARAVRSSPVSKTWDCSPDVVGTLLLREPRGITTDTSASRGSRSRVYARCVSAAMPGRGRCPTRRPSSASERCSLAVRRYASSAMRSEWNVSRSPTTAHDSSSPIDGSSGVRTVRPRSAG